MVKMAATVKEGTVTRGGLPLAREGTALIHTSLIKEKLPTRRALSFHARVGESNWPPGLSQGHAFLRRHQPFFLKHPASDTDNITEDTLHGRVSKHQRQPSVTLPVPASKYTTPYMSRELRD